MQEDAGLPIWGVQTFSRYEPPKEWRLIPGPSTRVRELEESPDCPSVRRQAVFECRRRSIRSTKPWSRGMVERRILNPSLERFKGANPSWAAPYNFSWWVLSPANYRIRADRVARILEAATVGGCRRLRKLLIKGLSSNGMGSPASWAIPIVMSLQHPRVLERRIAKVRERACRILSTWGMTPSWRAIAAVALGKGPIGKAAIRVAAQTVSKSEQPSYSAARATLGLMAKDRKVVFVGPAGKTLTGEVICAGFSRSPVWDRYGKPIPRDAKDTKGLEDFPPDLQYKILLARLLAKTHAETDPEKDLLAGESFSKELPAFILAQLALGGSPESVIGKWCGLGPITRVEALGAMSTAPGCDNPREMLLRTILGSILHRPRSARIARWIARVLKDPAQRASLEKMRTGPRPGHQAPITFRYLDILDEIQDEDLATVGLLPSKTGVNAAFANANERLKLRCREMMVGNHTPITKEPCIAPEDGEWCITPARLVLEGDQMSHCVAGYAPAVKSGQIAILSIKNADGRSTAEVALPGLEVLQHMGVKNHMPPQGHVEIINKWRKGRR